MPLQGIPALMVAKGRATVASSLLTGLSVGYALSDVSDATGGGLTLTNNGGVTFGAGKVGNAATFVSASNQFLSRNDNAAFQVGTGNFSIAAWLKFTSNTTSDFVVYGNPTGGAALGYAINQSGTHIGITIGDGTHGASKDSISVDNDGAWHLAVATFDRAGNASLYIDNGTPVTVDITAVTGTLNSAVGFGIGGNAAGTHLSDSSADEVYLWNTRVLTGAEVIAIWNTGAGVTYPFS